MDIAKVFIPLRTSAQFMIFTAIGALLFLALSLFFLARHPYGSDLFEIIHFFPLSVFLIIAIGNWPTKDLKQRKLWLIPCMVFWAITYYFYVTVSHRNDRFILELEGVVSSQYRGDHNTASIRVFDVSGKNVPVVGLKEADWEQIQVNDHFHKKRGTFEAHCAGRTLHLERKHLIDTFRLEQGSQQDAAPFP
jgi:hypothetical protein